MAAAARVLFAAASLVLVVVAGASGGVGARTAAAVTRVGCCDADPAWAPSGDRLAFSRNGTIHSVGVDGSAPRYVTYGLQPAWSPDGSRLAYPLYLCESRYTGCYSELNSYGPGDGSTTKLRPRTNFVQYGDPTWSPDGRFVAYTQSAGSGAAVEINVVGADGAGDRFLTQGFRPAWSPRGDWIAYSDTHDVYLIHPDGSGRRRLTTDAGSEDDPSWAPDGTRLVFNGNSSGKSLLYTIGVDGFGETAITSGGNDVQPAWSPDGLTIAFVSDRARPGVAPSTIFLLGLGSGVARAFAPTVAFTVTGIRCTIEATGAAQTIVGGPGNDVICGTGHRDVIRGRGGNDVVDGGIGGDTIDGGPGNDVLLGNLNFDRIEGGPGNDTIVGGTGVDRLLGGAGADSIDARDLMHDVVDGGAGRDSARVDKGDKVVRVERLRRF